MLLGSNWFNSLRPSDAIWRQWSWTTLAQVMACCLTAPSHYLNQCWLIIRGVLWHTSESSFAGIAQGIDSGYEFEKYILKNIFKSPRGQWVNHIYFDWGIIIDYINSLWPTNIIWQCRSGSTIGAGNGLLPDGTKPLPESVLMSSKVLVGIQLRAISHKVLMNQIHNMCLEITVLKLLHLPGANELTQCGLVTPYGDTDLGQHRLR